MADTKEFDVVRVARSDGADTGPGYWPVTTAPPSNAAKKSAKDALPTEKTPRAKPQMTRLAEDDPRFVEWRVKLGILLKQELSPNPEGEYTWAGSKQLESIDMAYANMLLCRGKLVVCPISERLLAL